MRTRSKIAVAFWVLFAGYLLVQSVFVRMIVLKCFAKIEKTEIRNTVARVNVWLDEQKKSLWGVATDWAIWDELHQFSILGSTPFVRHYCTASTYRNLNLQAMIISDSSGALRYATEFDPASGRFAPISPEVKTYFLAHARAVIHRTHSDTVSDIILTANGPMLVSMSPIKLTDTTRAPGGALLFGRSLSDKVVSSYARSRSCSLTVARFDRPLPVRYTMAKKNQLSNDSIVTAIQNKRTLLAYAPVFNQNRDPVLLLELVVPRTIYHAGWMAVIITNCVVAALFIIFGILLWILFRISKKMERTLLEKERYLQTVLHDSHLGILALDKERGTIMHANPAACTMLGRTLNELTGANYNTFFKVVSPRNPGDLQNDTGQYEKLLLAGSGTTLPVLTTTSTIFQNGRKIRIETFMDISQRKQAEDALVRAQKLESLGILAGGIAHDFNNLLSGIFGYIDLVRLKASSNTELAADLREAMKTIERARHLTRQLLTFAKGGAPKRKPLAIAELLHDTIPFALAGTRITHTLTVMPGLWLCNADRSLIEQVVDNLIINARQAMPEGGAIAVAADNAGPGTQLPTGLHPGSYVRIQVCDQGCGIKSENLKHIFDPFFTTKEYGSGLGLTTAYSIIAKHDGHIGIQSKDGAGTTVTFFLPAMEHAVSDATEQICRDVAGSGVVLVVDDEDVVRTTSAEMLRYCGYEVHTAKSSDDARTVVTRQKLMGRPIQVVICDLTLKGRICRGTDVVALLKQADPSIIAIVSSGYNDDPVMADPQRHGFVSALHKPFTYEELGHVTTQAMAQWRSEG